MDPAEIADLRQWFSARYNAIQYKLPSLLFGKGGQVSNEIHEVAQRAREANLWASYQGRQASKPLMYEYLYHYYPFFGPQKPERKLNLDNYS